HLRDFVVTEYGIADLRGKTDAEVIAALLNVADSRFQENLRQEAVRHGKLSSEYRIPEMFQNNLPDSYQRVLNHFRHQGLFPAFPFGTDLTEQEIIVGRALKVLKKKLHDKAELAKVLIKGMGESASEEHYILPLRRMGLEHPKNLKERIYQRLLLGAMAGGRS
ncbi:MAG: acetyl-CoA hydrolase, partial [Bdellovibrionales bacterium]|nr:acetyl-CoA hydrolase [Bdellovibrionales bacterium]